MENSSDTRLSNIACCGAAGINISQEAIAQQAKLLSALADITRLGIVTMLARLAEPVCVCDIVAQFNLGQPTISHHLRILRDSRMVQWEKRGLWVYYSLNPATLQQAEAYIGELLNDARVTLAVSA